MPVEPAMRANFAVLFQVAHVDNIVVVPGASRSENIELPHRTLGDVLLPVFYPDAICKLSAGLRLGRG